MIKELAIIHHFGSGNADFSIRANGKLEWEGPGDEPTEEELEQWEAERLLSVDLSSQKSQCAQLLKDSDKKINGDWPYQDDIPTWLAVRQQWRDIIKSNEVMEIPDKPF